MAKETPGPQPLVQDPFGHMQPKTPPKQGAPRPQAPNLQAQAAMPQAAKAAPGAARVCHLVGRFISSHDVLVS